MDRWQQQDSGSHIGTTHRPQVVISKVPLLTAEESRDVRCRLEAIRSQWIDRDPAHPGEAFTLGVASYIDAADEKFRAGAYFGRVEHFNRVLRRNFADLLATLRRSLGEQLGVRFSYSPKLAVPGFHIFFGAMLRRMQNLAPHFDNQYQNLPQTAAADPRHVVSFTLPISLPSGGGGLDYWDVDREQYRRDLNDGKIKLAADYPSLVRPSSLPYEIGELVVQDGSFLHRIAGTAGIVDSDERITLQGHAFKKGGSYIMYW